ncbi:hypothetical protein A2592_01450 [Candidatus Kaiserbacteria bacterium RIFOXYD1_FULL_42_15]|uniref:Uncharacterized protein n=1 Tax=Candidatus Kaiserbacteria bacterium RIFOXYD1_FULL_42_15 TaxID=1798532 RepID=A0A1F6FPY4_9BACT|nr:MAG: hypothetical protein A2592_01450 [Candidatus Kaiserbacteria bacterium RIFOXYD1_FULL_42_15]
MTTQIIFKIDAKIKAKAMKRAKSEGVPFAVFLKMATEKYADGEFTLGIVESDEKFNAKTARAVRTALKDIKAEKNLVRFASDNEMDKHLLSL